MTQTSLGSFQTRYSFISDGEVRIMEDPDDQGRQLLTFSATPAAINHDKVYIVNRKSYMKCLFTSWFNSEEHLSFYAYPVTENLADRFVLIKDKFIFKLTRDQILELNSKCSKPLEGKGPLRKLWVATRELEDYRVGRLFAKELVDAEVLADEEELNKLEEDSLNMRAAENAAADEGLIDFTNFGKPIPPEDDDDYDDDDNLTDFAV